jgi:hypothetical protein
MSYLAIARSVVTGYERNESDEKRWTPGVSEVELLKASIIAAVDVEPGDFDRAKYDRLWMRGKALEAAGETL